MKRALLGETHADVGSADRGRALDAGDHRGGFGAGRGVKLLRAEAGKWAKVFKDSAIKIE